MAKRKPVTPITNGDLKNKITIEQLTLVSDGQGGQVESWSAIATDYWAYVRETSASERLYAQKFQTQRSHEIWLRHDSVTSTITEKMRVIYDGKILQVKGVRNYDTRDSYIILDCELNRGN